MADPRLDALKQRYHTVLTLMEKLGVKLLNLHVQDNKLVLRGQAKSREDSNKVWDQIKLVNKDYQQELAAEILFDQPSAAERSAANAAAAQAVHAAQRTHTIKAGDTLSKLAKIYYGDAHDYMRIFEANRDKMPNPNTGLHPGDVIVIPD
jgi:nucleoid-associated protein YgaU